MAAGGYVSSSNLQIGPPAVKAGGGTVTDGFAAAMDDGSGGVRTVLPPTNLALAAIVAGLMMLLGGGTELWPSATSADLVFASTGRTEMVLGVWGIVAGVSLIGLALLTVARAAHVRPFGAAMVAISAVSILSNWGGFFVGAALGVIAGLLILRWKASIGAGSAPAQGATPRRG